MTKFEKVTEIYEYTKVKIFSAQSQFDLAAHFNYNSSIMKDTKLKDVLCRCHLKQSKPLDLDLNERSCGKHDSTA